MRGKIKKIRRSIAIILLMTLVMAETVYAQEIVNDTDEIMQEENTENNKEAESEEEIAEEMADEEIADEEVDAKDETVQESLDEIEADEEIVDKKEPPVLTYRAHVQEVGWQEWKNNSEIAGTKGQKLRMEAVIIDLGSEEWNTQIEYRVHVQEIGWQNWVNGGEIAGTCGKALRIEAIQIRFAGELEKQYDVFYTTHVSYLGDMDWVANGAFSGTTALSEQMESLKIQLVEKNSENAPVCGERGFRKAYPVEALTYSAHIQTLGDVQEVTGGKIQGTTGKKLRMEGIRISLDDSMNDVFDGSVKYRVHIQDIGWQEWKEEGELAGTTGVSKRIEAIQISLSGEAALYNNIYYRAHVENFGWLGWASNGQKAGTEKISQQMEAIQIVIVPKHREQSGYKNTKVSFRDTYVYQNPRGYLQINHKQKVLYNGGYNLSSGYMGLKVSKVQRKLGLGIRRAIMDSTTISAVKRFQRNNGLPATGVVDLSTWKKIGFSEYDWYNLGTYASPVKTNPASTRKQCIENMISTAYSYLGTEYIIGASGKPGTGTDCSGLVMQALYSAGIDPAPVDPVRHSHPGYEYESRNLWNLPMKHVAYRDRQRGDLIFYSDYSGTIIHVAIYLGNNQVIESWPPKVVVWPIKNSQRSIIKGVARPFV